MKKFIYGLLAFALVCVTGTFIVIGVLGGNFASMCLSSDAAQLEGKDNEEKIFNFWVKSGFSPAQAAGITANLKMESGYSPFRQEDAASWPAGGYGIAQFTGGQRAMATGHMIETLGPEFTTYYLPTYGGRVTAEKGYIPDGIAPEVNDRFLASQLVYLSEYMASFKPSSIPIRTRGFQALTGLEVPSDATLKEYILSLGSAGDVAKAWTFLYEYPGAINTAANRRAEVANDLLAKFSGGSNGEGGPLQGVCGVGNVVAPTDGEGTLYVTSGFAMRTRSSGITRPHQGIDIVTGDTIRTIMSGTVTVARYYGGYGYAVKIDHGNGTHSLYGHMVPGSLQVKEGDTVSAGQPLGTMGNSGDSEGVHLHFQVWVKDELVNPFPFLMDQGIPLEWTENASPINTKPGPL